MINWDDFDYHSPMGTRRGRLRKLLDRKQFQYIGVVSDELLVGCALGNFSYLGLVFVYTYESATGRLREFSTKVPLARGFSLSNRPADGTSEVTTSGGQIRIVARPEPRNVNLQVQLKSGLDVDATFDLAGAHAFQPLALCTQTGKAGWVFTEKIAGVAATGTVTGPFGTKDLAEIGAHAHSDYTIGYPRHETFWNWACFSGAADGKLVGLNLSCGVNETSYSENCIWVDGALIPAGLARFDYNRAEPENGRWSVTTGDGVVDLEFEPEGTHRERLNVLLLASNFKQVFGKFSGVLRPPGQPEIVIRDQYGFVEDQYARW